MSDSAPSQPLVKVLVVDDRNVRSIVKALAAHEDWKHLLQLYGDATDMGQVDHEDLPPLVLAPVMREMLAVVQRHVEFRGKASLRALGEYGAPKMFLKVLQLQTRKRAAALEAARTAAA